MSAADGASFVYRGVDFGGDNYGVYVVSRKWPRLPKPRVNLSQYAQADGGVTQGSSFEQRRIVLDCVLAAASESARNSQMSAVVAKLALSQYTGPAALVVDYFPTLQWNNARLMEGIDSELAQNGEVFQLVFTADPWPTATSSTTSSANAISGSTPVSLTPGGDIDVPASWVIKNGATPSSGVTISNASSGESAVWTNNLPALAWLRLNSETQKFEVSENSGVDYTEVAANGVGIIPRVVGGTANSITFNGISSGTFDLTYTAGYRQ